MPRRTLDEFLAIDDKNLKEDIKNRRDRELSTLGKIYEYF